MFHSGVWRGFWHQDGFGRQEMSAFELHFKSGVITGRGVDIVGPFRFAGDYDPASGKLTMTKQYLGKHQVRYEGTPDGEGCILGTWELHVAVGRATYEDKGTFLMKPELPPATGDEPIVRIGSK